jgi:hypothetical protein
MMMNDHCIGTIDLYFIPIVELIVRTDTESVDTIVCLHPLPQPSTCSKSLNFLPRMSASSLLTMDQALMLAPLSLPVPTNLYSMLAAPFNMPDWVRHLTGCKHGWTQRPHFGCHPQPSLAGPCTAPRAVPQASCPQACTGQGLRRAQSCCHHQVRPSPCSGSTPQPHHQWQPLLPWTGGDRPSSVPPPPWNCLPHFLPCHCCFFSPPQITMTPPPPPPR